MLSRRPALALSLLAGRHVLDQRLTRYPSSRSGDVRSPGASPVFTVPWGSMSMAVTSAVGFGAVLHAARHHVDVVWAEFDIAVSQLDGEPPQRDEEQLVRSRMTCARPTRRAVRTTFTS